MWISPQLKKTQTKKGGKNKHNEQNVANWGSWRIETLGSIVILHCILLSALCMLDIFFFNELGVSRIGRMQRWKGLLSVGARTPSSAARWFPGLRSERKWRNRALGEQTDPSCGDFVRIKRSCWKGKERTLVSMCIKTSSGKMHEN